MVERRSRRGAQATVPAPTVIPKRKKKVIPSSEKSRHHEAEDRSHNVHEVENDQQTQTPESTTRKLRSSALKADPIGEQDTPGSRQRNIQFATREFFTSNIPDTPRGGHPDGQDFETPEEGLQAVLSQEDYKTWQKLISELKNRGLKLPSFRIQRRAALKGFLDAHPKAISLHDRYARNHNKDYEGKHERFHLPVLEETGMEKVRASKEKEVAQVQRSSRRSSVRTSPTANVLAMQLDGAMDVEMEESPQLADEHEAPTAVAADETPPSSDRNEEDTAPAVGNSENVVFEQPPAQKDIAQPKTDAVAHSHEAEAVMDMGEGQEHTETCDKDAQHSSDLPMVSSDDPPAAAVTPPVVIGSAETDFADLVHPATTEYAAAEDLIAATDSTPHVAKDPPAQSYLAWLHQRQTQFPIAKPNYSECVALAQRLGRTTGHVYDEILYRWGLETDSRRGVWYKQNRLQVLGEDPRFDEETIGKWEAWLKQERDLDAGRS